VTGQRYTPIKPPTPIRVAKWFLTAAATVSVGAFIMAPLNIGTYTYYGRSVTGPEFLALDWGPMVVLAAATSLLCIGLWTRRAWVRPAFVALIALALLWEPAKALRTSLSAGVGNGAIGLFIVGLACWYLYGSTNARDYFDSLRAAA